MIYLDTNIIVYALENHPKYGSACRKILVDIESGRLKACASMLVLIEMINVLTKLNKILHETGKERLNIPRNVEAVLSLPIVWLELNFYVIKKAAEYDHNVSGVDYVHLAAMELNSVTKIISADAELSRIEFIKRIDPLGY